MNKKSIRCFFLTLCLVLTGCSDTTDQEPITIDIFAMDTVMTLSAFGPKGKEALSEAEKEINRLEAMFSTTIETSEIASLNQNKTLLASPETIAVLEAALQYHAATEGAFNPAVFPIVKAWGFTTDTFQVPTQDEIDALLPYTDFTQMKIDHTTALVTLPPQMEIGLGGIVKGYTSQRVMELFSEMGLTSALVNLGGNVQALGAKPDGSPWNIAIKHPLHPEQNIGALAVTNKAVITSGAYERFFESEGRLYHHLIDPKTGFPAENELASVTIVSNNGTMGDACTKLFIAGPEDAVSLLQKMPEHPDAIFVTKDNRILITEGLKDSFTLLDKEAVLEIIAN